MNGTEIWKLTDNDLGNVKWLELQCNGKQRSRTVASIGTPKNITGHFKLFQIRTVQPDQARRGPRGAISGKANAPCLRTRCNEGYTEIYDENIANLRI